MTSNTRNLYENRVQGNVLIVDDHLDNLVLLQELMLGRGHSVRCVRDGQSALDTIHTELPDVVLLDIRLPDMNGYEICEMLRDNAETRNIPIIFLSALNAPADRIRGFEVGADDYISKPFNEHEVISRVESKLLHTYIIQQQRDLDLYAERQRIARDLHDSLQQSLFILGATASELAQDGTLPDGVRKKLANLNNISASTLSELKLLVYELQPEKLLKTPLHKLLARLVESNGVRSEAEIKLIAVPKSTNLPPDVHIAFYRIAQESLNNAIIHAGASLITVMLQHDTTQVTLRVSDNGRGFDPHTAGITGGGVENMKGRADDLQLHFSVGSIFNEGTEVQLIWHRAQT